MCFNMHMHSPGVRQSCPPNPGGHLHCPSYGLHSPALPHWKAGNRQLKHGGHFSGSPGLPGRRGGICSDHQQCQAQGDALEIDDQLSPLTIELLYADRPV